MIEIIIRNYLEGALDVPVFLQMPEVPSEEYPVLPDEFVLIQKIAGAKTNHIDYSAFACQSYSLTSMQNAAELDMRVREKMEQAAELPVMASVRLASNYNFTDTATKRYRYQAVFDIYHYGG